MGSSNTARPVDEDWLHDAVAVASRREWPEDGWVDRLRALLAAAAVGFAQRRPDVHSPEVRWPSRRLHPDEAAAFLTALDRGLAEVDDSGYVTLRCVRPKTPPGRYALLSRNGHGVSVNLEYLIQIGATAELVASGGWSPADLDFERGEFDALGFAPDGRVVLAMEAKATVQGPDGLESLVRQWLQYPSLGRGAPVPSTNAGRKWIELGRLSEAGPVTVLLVAAGARWCVVADLDPAGDLRLRPAQEQHRPPAQPMQTGRSVLWLVPYRRELHRAASFGARGQCSWYCSESALYSARVRETGGSQSTFALCDTHRARVENVYGSR